MSIAARLSSGKKLLPFPYIQLNGAITRESTLFVTHMLEKVPTKSKKLAIVINSNSGSFAQAHLINTKLNIFAEKRGIELYTFIQECALNAGFLVATNGHKVYADTSSIIGGVEVNSRKFILGDFIDRVTYANQSSYSSQHNTTEFMNKEKKQQIEKIFSQFSSQGEASIRQKRKLSEDVDLSRFYTCQQAKKVGLIDEVGRIHQTISSTFKQYEGRRLQENSFERIRNDLRKLNIW